MGWGASRKQEVPSRVERCDLRRQNETSAMPIATSLGHLSTVDTIIRRRFFPNVPWQQLSKKSRSKPGQDDLFLESKSLSRRSTASHVRPTQNRAPL